MKRSGYLVLVAGLACALTGCGSAAESQAKDVSTAYAVTSSATATPTATTPAPASSPSTTESQSATLQIASTIYTSQQSFVKAASDFDHNDCVQVLSSGMTGPTSANCVLDLATVQATGSTIALELDSAKPWASDVSERAGTTWTTVKAAADEADTTNYSLSNLEIVQMRISLAVFDLLDWPSPSTGTS